LWFWGKITWADYRPDTFSNDVRIFHHKTRAEVWLPLNDADTVYRRAHAAMEPAQLVPAGVASQHMPVGMQIVGAPYHDDKVFRIAHSYEAASPRMFEGDLMPDFRAS